MNELTGEMLEELLSSLGQDGTLDEKLNEADIDLILGYSSGVNLSANFEQRALRAIREAQAKRVQVKPLSSVSSLIRASRLQSGIELDLLTKVTNIEPAQIIQIESGRLTIQQFIRLFPPARIEALLHAIHIRIADFADKLIDATASSEKQPAMGRTGHDAKRNTANSLRSTVSSYILELEELDRSR